jgi:hypothetical protein
MYERYESAAAMQADLEQAIEEMQARTSMRQVGKIVAESFAELRQSIKTIIEAQLRDERAAPINLLVSENDGVLAEEAALSGDLWGLPSAVSVSRASLGEATARRRRTFSVAGGALIVAAAGSVFALRHFNGAAGHEEPHAEEPALAAAAPPPVAPLPAVTASVTEPKSIHVQIAAEPPSAKLFLDGALLAGDPFTGEMKPDSVAHTLRVEAPGYRTQTVSVSLDHPVDTKIKLDPVPWQAMGPSRVPPHTGPASSAPSASASAAAAAHQCSTLPYYYDEQGIKRVRPECLK